MTTTARTAAAAVPIERATTPPRTWLAPVAFALLLLLYNNLIFGLPGDLSFPRDPVFYPRALLIPLLAVVWAVRAQGLGLEQLGVTTRNLWRSAAWGLAAAIAVTVPAVLFFLFPLGMGEIDYTAFANDSVGEFTFWSAVRYPLSAALFEEVLFRGVLLALALRTFRRTPAIAFTAVVFAGWHICVNYVTMSDSAVAADALEFAMAQTVAMAALIVAGLVMAEMRLRTGSLAGPVVFHWLAVVAINATLFAQAR
jgi:membrane protease YdiL (CAAX protease family)